MAFQTGQELSYQRMLRALGAYLDNQNPVRFSIVEVPDGFDVVLGVGSGRPDLEEVHFERRTLLDYAEQLTRGKKVFDSKGGAWRLGRNGRQDFLWALGFELDDSQAHGILLDETEEGMLVTYSYLDPSQGYSWRKHMVMVGAAEIEEILRAAYSRRKRGLLSALRR